MGRFDFKKVDDFEKHIELSIPNFLTLDNIFKHVTHEFAQPESTVVDLGCSTGRFLSGLTQIEGCQYVFLTVLGCKEESQSAQSHKASHRAGCKAVDLRKSIFGRL